MSLLRPLRWLAFVGIGWLLPLTLGLGAPRPNVLFLAVDDLNDWVGFLGGYAGTVHTPHLDRLAASGTIFTNAHTAAPVCCPSRIAAMSGLLPSTTGLYNNQHWWKPNRPDLLTLPIQFRRHGYQAVGTGKIFHHTAGNNPPSQWDRYQRILFHDNAWIRHGSPLYPWTAPAERPANFPFCGLKLYSEEVDWGTPPYEESSYDDVVTTDFAVRYLSERRARPSSKSQPFFLACGIFHPHLPWYVPQRYLDLYPLEKVPLPEVRPDDLDDVPAPGRKLALRKADDLAKIRAAGQWKSAVRHYLASISFADAQIGRILDALAASDESSHTIIVLWSDHGWHLGEKGHWHKRTLWEEATRIPFVIAAPGLGQPGQRCAEAVSLVDLFPTLLELCGLPPIENLDGTSLVPWLRDPERPKESPALIIEESGHMAARSRHHRYILYKNGDEELYDHRLDPNEWNNLAADPEQLPTKKWLASFLPDSPAPPALTKQAFRFNPDTFSFTHKESGRVVLDD